MRVVDIFWLLFYFPRLSSSYNMALQANIVVKKDFFKNYLRSSQPASLHFDIEIPPGLASALGYEFHKNLRSGGRLSLEEPWERKLKHVPRLVDYLVQESYERFRNTVMNFSEKIEKHHKKNDLSSAINATFYRYQSKIRQYADDLIKVEPDNQLDKDLVFLDIVQTSNRFIYEETLKCLSTHDDHTKTPKKDAIQNLAEDVFTAVLFKKKEDFNFVCKMMNICRPFPGFTDYLADFFGELIKLPDDKMHTLIMKTIMVVKKKKVDVESIVGKTLMKKLDKQLQNIIYDDLLESRKAIAAKRKDIFDRYKAKKVSNNTKGFRLLLDMIDKAFDLEGEKDVSRHFNIITNALRDWLGGLAVNVEVIELAFLDYVANTLSKRWVKDISKEARALVDIMLEGKPAKRRNEYLLVNGSYYVNNIRATVVQNKTEV